MEQLLQEIAQPLSKHEYFSLILQHGKAVILSTNTIGKIPTAKLLGMSPQAFSTAFPLITAHLEITTVEAC